jgi:hypothetical protein
VEQILSLFYADDGCVSSTNHTWLQTALTTLSELFQRIGLTTNTQKTVLMTTTPTPNRLHISSQAYTRRNTGDGLSYTAKQRQITACQYCGVRLCTSSLPTHLHRLHRVEYTAVATPCAPTTPPIPTSTEPYKVCFPRGTTIS